MTHSPILYCPRCKTAFSEDTTNTFFEGKLVVCEKCGLSFRRYLSIQEDYNFQKDSRSKKQISQKRKNKKTSIKPKPLDSSTDSITTRLKKITKNIIKSVKKTFKPINKVAETETPFSRDTKIKSREKSKNKNKYKLENHHLYDPFTGMPLDDMKRKKNRQNKTQDKAQAKEEKDIEIFLNSDLVNKIFSVLEPSIRKRLKTLNITENEKTLIAKSFIYLNLNQQKKYITELEQHSLLDNENSSYQKEREKLIETIKNIPIPKSQQQHLIDQLQYFGKEEQHKFVENLKKKA